MILRSVASLICACAFWIGFAQLAMASGIQIGAFAPSGAFPRQTGFHARATTVLFLSALVVLWRQVMPR